MSDHIKSLEFYKGVTIVRIAGSGTFDNLSDVQAEYGQKGAIYLGGTFLRLS